MKNLHDKCKVVPAIPPRSVTGNTSQESAWIDTLGYGGLEFIIAIGAIATAGAMFSVLIEASASAGQVPGDIEAATDDELLGRESLAGFSGADDNKVRKIGYRGSRRYVRISILPIGNNAAAFLSVVAFLAPKLD